MKTVFENRMVAHVWAQQNQYEGRSSNSQFYFRDKTIFSYRDSWPLATFIKPDEVLLNTERVSMTTAKHLHYVRSALKSDAKIWHVDCAIIKNPDAFLKLSPKKREKLLADKLAADIEGEKQRKRDAAKRKREQVKAEKASLPDLIARWHNNDENLTWAEKRVLDNRITSELLRLKDADTVETSKGATFPKTHAKKAFKIILACNQSGTTWQKNGKTIHLGNFQIDTIDTFGNVKAGCHDVAFTEILKLTESKGW